MCDACSCNGAWVMGLWLFPLTTGHSELVNILLSNGASPSVLLPSGELYYCTEFHGVQHLLDTHQQTHTRLVFDAIADKKGLARLKSTFLVRFFWLFGPFLQRVSIACYAERCISHSKSVRPSVCPSVRPSHAGTESKRLKLRSWDLHWRIAPWL